MGMFKQPGAMGGRAAAEAKNAPGNFPQDMPYNYQQGVPTQFAGGTYRDDAEGAPGDKQGPKIGQVPANGRGDTFDPSPFGSLRDK